VNQRWRIFLAAVLMIVLPLVGLSWVLRHQVAAQFEREFHHRAAVQLAAALSSLQDRGQRITTVLDGVAVAMQDDNQLRLGLSGGREDLLLYVRDAAGRAMHLGGLQVLQLQDEDGVILSSGHYRQEFGRREAALAGRLRQARWPRPDGSDAQPAAVSLALARIRLPDAEVLALVALRPVAMAGRRFDLIGGEIISGTTLAGLSGAEAALTLTTAAGPGIDGVLNVPPGVSAMVDAAGALILSQTVPLIRGDRLEPATLSAGISLRPLRAAIRELDLTLSVALAAALAGAFGLAAWLSGRLSRPLQELAGQAARVDLDDPAVALSSPRRDEVGQLSRVLDAMLLRLREDARRLADLEHRATLGEVARQVNHDLRNGLTPVRNVLRHLSETALNRPAAMAAVFTERQPTLDSSLAYLEDLAGRYARLAPESRRERCDLGAIAREAALGVPEATVRAAPNAPAVLADPVALRRILDNLLRNAREALTASGGRIEVTVDGALDPDLGAECVLAVRDDGVGMPADLLARVCEDFFTTKPGGTGLGLSNVRRLASDAGGRLAIDSTPGAGTTVTITFPAAETDA
jgi:signal transduction histidine kinase